MKIAITILFITLTIILLHWYLKQPIHHKIKRLQIKKYVDDFLLQLGNGAILIINHKKSNKFIQFAKYIDNNITNLTFGFPNAPWSKSYYPKVISVLKEKGYTIEEENINTEPVTSFIRIDFIKNSDEATKIAYLALDIMEINPDEELSATLQGPFDENYVSKLKEQIHKKRAA